jgi:hypothetical protein
LYTSPNIIEAIKSRIRWHVACMGEMRNANKILVRKLEGNRPLRTPSHRWEGNSGMDLGKQGRKVWTGCIWLRIGTCGGLVSTL